MKRETNVKRNLYESKQINSVFRLDETYIAFRTDRPDSLDRTMVGNEGVDLRQMADTHRGRTFELRGIRNENDMPGVGHDGLRHLHLTEVEVQKRTVLIDRRHADNRKIDLELRSEEHTS